MNNVQPQLFRALLTQFEINVSRSRQVHQYLNQLSNQITQLERQERRIGQNIVQFQELIIRAKNREIQLVEEIANLNQQINTLREAINQVLRQFAPSQEIRIRCPHHQGNFVTLTVTRTRVFGDGVQFICPIGLSRTCNKQQPIEVHAMRSHIARCIRKPGWVCPGPPDCRRG